MRIPILVLLSASLFLSTVSCGGAVGEVVRPEDHTAAGAVGRTSPLCEGGPKAAKPLIVDLDPDSRVELEAAMKRGVAVVSFDCKSLRILTACKVPDAKYEYAGVSRKEQVIQMTDLDDLRVNLPIQSGKLGGELTSGRSIDLALVRVGLTSTPLGTTSRAELQGTCDGATHFVQNATVGAFSMATGSAGKVGAVGEMFGIGAGASSSSDRKAVSKDGSLDDCRKSDPDSPAPPTECRSPLQVALVPILGEAPLVKGTSAKPPSGKVDLRPGQVAAAENPCPAGFSFAQGVCERGEVKPAICSPKDAADCKVQCEKGSAESCLNLARLTQPAGAAMPFFKKACDGGAFDGCGALAVAMMPARESAAVEADARAALAVANKGCDGGSGFACQVAGWYQIDAGLKVVNVKEAVAAYERGCTLGHGEACAHLAVMYFEGDLVPADARRGVEVLDKACQAGGAAECIAAGMVHRTGRYGAKTLEGISTDPDKAETTFRRACELDAGACSYASAELIEMGDADLKEVHRIALRGCGVDDAEACARVARMYTLGEGVAKDEARAKEFFVKACQEGKGDEESCNEVGVPMK